MRHAASLILFVPAVFAQATTPEASLGQRLRAERPEIERLIAELQARDALTKAEALLPAELPPFNKVDNQVLVASYVKYLELSQAYYIAFKAADAAGYWEKALDHIKKAREISGLNFANVKGPFAQLVEYEKNLALRTRAVLKENEGYVKELRDKKEKDPSDKQQLELVEKEEKNILDAEKWAKIFQGYLENAKADSERYAPFQESEERRIKDQEERIAEYKAGKGEKGKWVEAIAANPKTMDALTEKKDRIAFLYRLNVLDPENKKVLKQIDVLLGKAAPEPEKPAKRKKNGK